MDDFVSDTTEVTEDIDIIDSNENCEDVQTDTTSYSNIRETLGITFEITSSIVGAAKEVEN